MGEDVSLQVHGGYHVSPDPLFIPQSTALVLWAACRKVSASGIQNAVRMAGMAGAQGKYTLPELPYDYNALEPVISADIMKLHHDKHHQTYVTNLNAAEDKMMTALKNGKVFSQSHNAVRITGLFSVCCSQETT